MKRAKFLALIVVTLALLAAANIANAQSPSGTITIQPENRCSPYNRDAYPYPQSVENGIIARMGGRIYGPYTGQTFSSPCEPGQPAVRASVYPGSLTIRWNGIPSGTAGGLGFAAPVQQKGDTMAMWIGRSIEEVGGPYSFGAEFLTSDFSSYCLASSVRPVVGELLGHHEKGKTILLESRWNMARTVKCLGLVDVSKRQARSAQSTAGKWGSRRYLAVRQGPSALSFLMYIPNESTSLRASIERVRRLRCQGTARAKSLGFKLNTHEFPFII